MRRPTATLSLGVLALLALAVPPGALGHGSAAEQYRTTVLELAPEGLPVDVRIAGDEVRFENRGDKELVICGYDTDECEAWVRIGPEGVFVDENSPTFHANQEADEFGEVPDDAGERADWVRVRREPPFFAYHDHRVHWMGGDTLPPGIDESDPDPQRVFDGRVEFRYGDTDGFMRTRLEYVGGRTWIQRYGEYALTGGAVGFMLVFFAVDARRRRRRADEAAPTAPPAD